MTMKKILLTVAGSVVLLMGTGCKPTERNYQAAYEKAAEAARLKNEEEQTGAFGNKLESLDGPRREIVGADTLLIGSGLVKSFESTLPDDGKKIGIAISRYTQPTNARRQLQDLNRTSSDGLMASDGQGNYYVMIKRVDTLPDAAEAIRVFAAANPDYPYIGLNGNPLVFYLSE